MRQALALGLLGLLAASAARLSALDPSAGLTEPTVVLVEGSHTANATVATGASNLNTSYYLPQIIDASGHYVQFNTTNATLVPQNLFAFWVGEAADIPMIVQGTLALMSTQNPHWLTYVLDDRSFDRVPRGPSDDPLSPQHISDWVRIAAIARYGGVYFDATVIELQPLEHIFDPAFDGVQGFTLGAGAAFTNDTIGGQLGNEQMENFAFAAQRCHHGTELCSGDTKGCTEIKVFALT